nr:MAG TPA: hypothetical protein [Caudoviricetes sp.]
MLFFYPFLWVAGYKEQRYIPRLGEPVYKIYGGK